jgi:ABC-2 type transport system ATP-binding protein
VSCVIEVEGVCKTYKSAWKRSAKQALDGVSLNVEEGETFGFVGPNGAGKSTLIKILVGVLQPTAGSARIFGCDVRAPEARKGLGFVPENPSLQDFLTPYEILLMGLRLHRVKVSDERAHCFRWLERLDLATVADRPLRGFSKGMMQRTALAHAMVIKPRLLVLDEPLSGLDPVGRKDVVDLLAEYRAQGGAIFLTSHVLHDVERLADRFGLIYAGKLLAAQSPNDLAGGEQFVTVRSLGVGAIPGFGAESCGRWFAEVRRDDLWSVLEQLRTSGHTLIEVKPTLTLESAFFRFLEPRDVGKQL